ncbi:hypothetical protein AB0H18_47340 [Streptomyces sp. NPDC020766]|uniref:hypothetical protein n=1 Tax=Streptomyces sp. NPDC020766 TaxID=3155011 RepID=UPI003402EE69
MDAVDGGRSRRLPVLVRFGVGVGIRRELGLGEDVAAVHDSDRPWGHRRMLIRRRSEVVSDIQQDRRRHHREVRQAQGFGLATAGVRLA